MLFNNSSKTSIESWVNTKKVDKLIQFNQEAWLKKPYIDINTKLRTETKNGFKKEFSKLTNNFVLEKTMENVRKHRDIKLVTTDKRRKSISVIT